MESKAGKNTGLEFTLILCTTVLVGCFELGIFCYKKYSTMRPSAIREGLPTLCHIRPGSPIKIDLAQLAPTQRA